MALNIEDPETERLATVVAQLTGETRTRAIQVALRERQERLEAIHAEYERRRSSRLWQFLRTEAWPQVPPEVQGNPLIRTEREEILGYGPEGV